MFCEIAYWTYYLCSKNKYLVREGTVTFVSLMFTSIHEYTNIACIIQLVGYYFGYNILGCIKIGSRYAPFSWFIGLILISPFLWFNYKRYFNIVKLNKTIERYASMSRGRHIAGILCYTIYVILTYYILYLIASS